MILGHLIMSEVFNERWQNTIIIIKSKDYKKVFELEYNEFLMGDDFGFINEDNEFTSEIYKYEILSIDFLENKTIIRIEKIGE